MTGTLSGALEARNIPAKGGQLTAEFKGTIEAPDKVLKITRIDCHYHLTIPKGKREAAERALNTFERNCPVAQTLKGCVEFHHEWTIQEQES
ncbi:OsmC family protein [Melghirimyces profundicolus]|uniref:OsmC family protein n=1 Tax=Melghirimyces profundicolus TaxID=1242148 RepID=UPI000D38FC9B